MAETFCILCECYCRIAVYVILLQPCVYFLLMDSFADLVLLVVPMEFVLEFRTCCTS